MMCENMVVIDYGIFEYQKIQANEDHFKENI